MSDGGHRPRTIRGALISSLLLLARRGRRYPVEPEVDPSFHDVPADERAEYTVAILLVLGSLCALAFIVLFAAFDDTQALGATLGSAFALFGAAAIVAGKAVVPQSNEVEERDPLIHPEAEQEVDEIVEAGGQGISRRRMLTAAAGTAGVTLGGALLAPVTSCGPNVSQRIVDTPWHKGRALVDERSRRVMAGDIQDGDYLTTAFPEGADPELLGSAIIVVRLPVSSIHLPDQRQQPEWAPEGLLAYSKICTHAACAVSLYRYPLFAPTSPGGAGPAFVCPCHYSTFDPARGAQRIFGPAGRPLPQLPLAIAPDGHVMANGPFSDAPGPAWFNVPRPKDQRF